LMQDIDKFMVQCQDALFWDDPECAMALRYLKDERCLQENHIRSFGVGYCMRSQEVFGRTPEEVQVNSKLRGRIVVPICSEFGRIVAAAGRHPLKSRKGWWNTPFRKEHYIYLFDSSRRHIFLKNKAYLFEGYMDAMALRAAGLENGCAIMGTTIGYRRIGLLARYCDRICLCFDTDKNNAGLMGQLKSIMDLDMFGFGSISRITMPEGVDPDEFVAANGLKAFESLEQDVSKRDIAAAKGEYEALRSRPQTSETGERHA